MNRYKEVILREEWWLKWVLSSILSGTREYLSSMKSPCEQMMSFECPYECTCIQEPYRGLKVETWAWMYQNTQDRSFDSWFNLSAYLGRSQSTSLYIAVTFSWCKQLPSRSLHSHTSVRYLTPTRSVHPHCKKRCAVCESCLWFRHVWPCLSLPPLSRSSQPSKESLHTSASQTLHRLLTARTKNSHRQLHTTSPNDALRTRTQEARAAVSSRCHGILFPYLLWPKSLEESPS